MRFENNGAFVGTCFLSCLTGWGTVQKTLRIEDGHEEGFSRGGGEISALLSKYREEAGCIYAITAKSGSPNDL